MKKNENKPVTLVVTDLDGTLLTSDKNVSEKNKEAIRKLKEHGILFGIASGRPVESGLILASQDWKKPLEEMMDQKLIVKPEVRSLLERLICHTQNKLEQMAADGTA